ncbi:MAG: hypothetical protein J6T17_02660 [Clostridia bacterium]|nr:hypothetical protein [Clostridia bacterium]
MSLTKEVYRVYRDHINEHREANRKGALRVKDTLEHSPVNYNGVLDKTAHVPKVYDAATIEKFQEISAVTHRIFEKVIAQYQKDPDYRRLFPFSGELEELMCLPIPYASKLPMARFDLFYNEETGDFKFCEINTDGTAAMIRDLEMRKALVHNPAHQAVLREFDLEPFELFDSWVKTFLELYKTYPKHVEHPNIAIADILDNATLGDFEEYMRRFQAAGVDCEICDLRDLEYRDGALWSPSGNKVDAVYRRAVTADVMEHYDACAGFLEAARNDDVFFAGAFATQAIHNKWLFYVLHRPESKAFLTPEETAFVEAHIPLTVEFSQEYIALEEVQKNKDRYMLKPMDAYASKGIYAAGREYSPEEWGKVSADLYDKGYLCQEYCEQYMTDNIDFAWGDGEWHPFINMPGLYTYNGIFAGFLFRTTCEEKIIVAHENERTLPVFLVKGRK